MNNRKGADAAVGTLFVHPGQAACIGEHAFTGSGSLNTLSRLDKHS